MPQGLEGEPHVVLDALLPSARVVDAPTAFSDRYPTVRLHLHIETTRTIGTQFERVF